MYDGVSRWGTICYTTRFQSNTADVACRQLGYKSANLVLPSSPLENVSFINFVHCGTDFKEYDSLDECSLIPWAHHFQSCAFAEVIEISCSGEIVPPYLLICPTK